MVSTAINDYYKTLEGTGKTTLINVITELFKSLCATNLLSKTVTSGVVITLMGGTTLHYCGVLPMVKLQIHGWTFQIRP